MRELILILALFVSGCVHTQYVTKPVPYTRQALGIETPEPVVLENVTLLLVKPSEGPAYFRLAPQSYLNMILNNKKVEGYIREANSRILECEAYYTTPIDEW